jgi:SAM-dependent methyltransferase
VTGIDLSAAMVTEAGDALAPLITAGRVELLVGSAARLPLPDASVDTAVCHRLIHHLPDAADRARVLAELARVARRSVVLSFADATSWKARSQRRRNIERRRYALTPEALYAEAEPHGLVPRSHPLRLAGIFSLVAVAVFTVARGNDAPTPADGPGTRSATGRS